MDERRAKLEAQLSAYLDDELTAKQRAEVEAFLVKDAQARAMLAELRAVSSTLRSLPRARASSDLMDNLRSRMERKALLGEQEARPIKTGGMSSTGRWVAAATIVLMTGVAGYVTWIFNGSDTRIASPHQQLTLSDQPRDGEPIVGKPLELAMNDSRNAKSVEQLDSVVRQESAPLPKTPTVLQDAQPPEDSSKVPPTETVATAYDADQTPPPPHAADMASMSIAPASQTSEPLPATVLIVACADDDSRQRLLGQVTAIVEGKVTADSESAISSCGVIQDMPADDSVSVSEIVVADARTRDDIVRQVSQGSLLRQTLPAMKRTSLASNAPTDQIIYADHQPSQPQAITAQRHVPGLTINPQESIQPNAAAGSSGIMADRVSAKPKVGDSALTIQSTANAGVVAEAVETHPAVGQAPGKYFLRLNIRVAEPASSRRAASSPAASLPAPASQTASAPATLPTSQP